MYPNFNKFTTLWAIELCCDMLMLYIVNVPDLKQVHNFVAIELCCDMLMLYMVYEPDVF